MRKLLSTALPLAALCIIGTSVRADAPRYRVTILDDQKHKYFLEARAISDAGIVVGVSIERTPSGTNPRWHGFLFRHGKYNEVGAPPGCTLSEAVAINTAGEIAGIASVRGKTPQAFIWRDNQLHRLSPGPGVSCQVRALSDSGVAVGTVTLPKGRVVAAVWNRSNGDATPHILKDFDRAVAIASNGDIALIESDQSYVLSQGRAVRLGTLGGGDAIVEALNSVGDVVGTSTTSNELAHAFLWRAGTIADVSRMKSLDGTAAVLSADSINDQGQVVGTVRDGLDTRAMLFENGHATNLNHLIPPHLLTLDVARAINNHGQIIGQGHIGQRYVSFLLTPLAKLDPRPPATTVFSQTPAGYRPPGPAPGVRPQGGPQDAGA